MPVDRRSRRLISFAGLFLFLYLGLCVVAGIYVADGTLHLARRLLTQEEETTYADNYTYGAFYYYVQIYGFGAATSNVTPGGVI